jgi:hypothetical protein
MSYIVDFGSNTNSEKFETMEEIEEWLDEYIVQHLQSGDDFETEKKRFIENNIREYVKYKELFNINSVYATSETVGDWEGQEKIAVEQFNKIIDAIYKAAPDETYDTKLYEIVKYAWDDWGSSEKLLTLTDDEIEAYAEGWF